MQHTYLLWLLGKVNVSQYINIYLTFKILQINEYFHNQENQIHF